MIKLLVVLIAALITPQSRVLEVAQTNKVLGVSVLLRAKEYKVNEDTFTRKYRLIGCSGTYIAPNVILTAAHCFENPVREIWVRGPNEKAVNAFLVKINPELDLALVVVKGPSKHLYAKVAVSVRQGEHVINVGSPYSLEFLLSDGIIARINDKERQFKSKFLITTAMINSGSSGGGAFNDAGELIGVNTMSLGMFGWSGISMAVDSDTIRKFLK